MLTQIEIFRSGFSTALKADVNGFLKSVAVLKGEVTSVTSFSENKEYVIVVAYKIPYPEK